MDYRKIKNEGRGLCSMHRILIGCLYVGFAIKSGGRWLLACKDGV